MVILKVLSYGKSSKGKDHIENEDSFLIDNKKKLFAVADGVSNPPVGREASRRIIKYLKKFFEEDLLDAIQKSNLKILEDRNKSPEIGYSTLTAINIKNDNLKLAHTGDSSAILVRENKIKKLTKNHSLLGTGILTKTIGMKNISPQIAEISLRKDDILILCTDGITSVINEEDILNIIKLYRSPKRIVDNLISEAEKRPQIYNDDKTAVAILVR